MFGTGQTISMKLLFYGQANMDANEKALKLEFDSKTFTSASKKIANKWPIQRKESSSSDSPGNGLCHVFAVHSARRCGYERYLGSSTEFSCFSRPPALLIVVVVLFFTISFFLAAVLKFEDLDFLIWVPGLVFLTTYVNQFPKVFAALFFMAASWLYLRKSR